MSVLPSSTGVAGAPRSDAAAGWADSLVHASAVVLLVLVPLHLVTLLIHPEETNAAALIERWDSRAWLLADWALLAVGSVHALAALWVRAEGASWSPVTKTRVVAGVGGVVVALFLAASWSMLLFV